MIDDTIYRKYNNIFFRNIIKILPFEQRKINLYFHINFKLFYFVIKITINKNFQNNQSNKSFLK